MKNYKITRVKNDLSNLDFVLKFPGTKTIDDIVDAIFIVKEEDDTPLAEAIISKTLQAAEITKEADDILHVSFLVTDYDDLIIEKLYKAALFVKWNGEADFDENVESIFDFEIEQNFHNNN